VYGIALVVVARCRPTSIHREIRVLSARRRCTARPCAGSGALGLSLAVAQGQPGAFGQQVGTPVCGLGQFGDRHGFRRTANAPDGGMLRRRPSDPTAKETIRVRAVHMCKIERLFESRQDTLSGGLP
jgi:hypothetical protein